MCVSGGIRDKTRSTSSSKGSRTRVPGMIAGIAPWWARTASRSARAGRIKVWRGSCASFPRCNTASATAVGHSRAPTDGTRTHTDAGPPLVPTGSSIISPIKERLQGHRFTSDTTPRYRPPDRAALADTPAWRGGGRASGSCALPRHLGAVEERPDRLVADQDVAVSVVVGWVGRTSLAPTSGHPRAYGDVVSWRTGPGGGTRSAWSTTRTGPVERLSAESFGTIPRERAASPLHAEGIYEQPRAAAATMRGASARGGTASSPNRLDQEMTQAIERIVLIACCTS